MNTLLKPQFLKPEERIRQQKIIDLMVEELVNHGATIEPDRKNVGAFAYKIQFKLENAVVTIGILIKEWQTDSDIVITNMTTLPLKERSRGYGSLVIGYIIDWAAKNSLNEIRATQITTAVKFWTKNRFIRCPEPNITNDFIYVI